MALSSGCNGEYTNYGIYSPVVYNVRTEDILTTGAIQKAGQYLSYGDVVRVIRPQATSLTGIPVAIGLAGNTTDVEVVASGLDRWQAGELIQDAFPDIPIDIREMMVSGMHPECWETMFGERDE